MEKIHRKYLAHNMKAPSLIEFVSAMDRSIASQPPRPRGGPPLLLDENGQLSPMADMAPDLTGQVTATDRNLDRVSIPPRPTMQAPPLRDMGAEAHRAGDAALMAGLFGLGLGSRGGVSAAPTLAAAAMQGSHQGADDRFKGSLALAEKQNKLSLENWGNQMESARLQEQDINRLGDEEWRQGQIDRQTQADSDRRGEKLRDDQHAFMGEARGLDEKSLQAFLANSEKSGRLRSLQLDIPRRDDGSFDVAVVSDPAIVEREATRKRLESTSLDDDMRQLVDTVRRTAPEGRQAVLNAVAPGLLSRGAGLTQDDGGNWSIPGVDLASLDAAPTGAWSPEAVAAKSDMERQKSYQKHGEGTEKLFRQFAYSGRVTGKVREELLHRAHVIGEAIHNGKQIPEYVFQLDPDTISNLSEKERETLQIARDGLGIRGLEYDERVRANKQKEVDRDLDRGARASRPSAALESNQTRYESLHASRAELDRSRRDAESRALKASATMRAIKQRVGSYPGAQTDVEKDPAYLPAFHAWKGADLEAMNYASLIADTDREIGKIEARYPALKTSRKAGASAAQFGPGWTPNPGYVPPGGAAPRLLDAAGKGGGLRPGESRTLPGGVKVKRVK